MSIIFDNINSDYISALKSQQHETVAALRLLISAIKNAELEKQQSLEDSEVIGVLQKQKKQRSESYNLYKDNNQPERAAKEAQEIEIIDRYLPAPLSDEEVLPEIEKVINEIKPKGIQDFGKVMAVLAPKFKGKIDGSKLVDLVKSKL